LLAADAAFTANVAAVRVVQQLGSQPLAPLPGSWQRLLRSL